MGCGASKDAALLDAAKCGDVDAARAALAKGADPNGTRQVRARARHAPRTPTHGRRHAGMRRAHCPIAPPRRAQRRVRQPALHFFGAL
jgi:hypothetical protein